jgi:hypothetical protein
MAVVVRWKVECVREKVRSGRERGGKKKKLTGRQLAAEEWRWLGDQEVH